MTKRSRAPKAKIIEYKGLKPAAGGSAAAGGGTVLGFTRTVKVSDAKFYQKTQLEAMTS